MRLRRQIDRYLRPVLFGLLQRLFHHRVAQSFASAGGRGHHAANHHVAALGFRVQQAQISHQLIILPTHQVMGIALQILAVEVRISTFLFDHEYIRAQLQQGIQLLFAQIAMMFADPLDCHFSIP